MALSSPSNIELNDDADSSRRRSGRVTHPPKHLSPSYSNGSAKRKRPDLADAGNDAASGSESEEESEDDVREKKRRAKKQGPSKPIAKRPKANGISTTLAVRPAASRSKKARKGAFVRDSAAHELGGLYAALFAANNNLDDVAAEWLRRFGEHQANALTEVVNLMLRSSGCNIEVNVYDIEDPDNAANKLTEIQEDFQAQKVVEYPLVARNKGAATFKKTLSGFFDSLIKGIAASSVLYNDPDLIENIQVWVSSMSSAASRPFRHTATVIALAIVSGLSEIGRDLVNSRAQSLRQLEGEKKKKNKVNQNRVKDLQSKADKAVEHNTSLDSILKDWFDTVFVHRYRDVDPRIRIDCVMYLGGWITMYPEHFFDGQHLRYLGWLLSDTAAGPRHEVVKQLQRIYLDQSKVAGLRQFTERFRPRIVEIAVRDTEINIRTSAIDLLNVLRDAGLLEPDDIDTIGKLIFDSDPRIRKAVAPFFAASVDETLQAKVEEMGGETAIEESLPEPNDDDFEAIRFDWLKWKSIAELLQSYDPDDEQTLSSHADTSIAALHSDSRFAFAAQALFPFIDDLESWEVLAGYLLFDSSQPTARGTDDIEAQLKEQCKLDEGQELILLDFLNASVRSRLDEISEDRNDKKSKRTKLQIRELQEKQETIAQRLATFVPRLLAKFGPTPEAASAVLRLEHVLDLDVFQELQQASATYGALLDNVKKQFMTHKTHGVLIEASAALLHGRTSDGLEEVTDGNLQALWDATLQNLLSQCKGEELNVRGGIDVARLEALSDTILRISSLASISDCTSPLETPKDPSVSKGRKKQSTSSPPVAPITLLLTLLGRGRPGSHMEPEVNSTEDTLVGNLIEAVHCYFLWHVRKIQQNAQIDRRGLDGSDLVVLTERRNTYVEKLHDLVKERRGADTLRVSAAEALLDVHTMFTVPLSLSDDPAALDTLIVDITPEIQADLQTAFAAVEADFAKKGGKKLEGPAEDDEPEDVSSDDEDMNDASPVSTPEPEEGAEGEDEEEAVKRAQRRAERKQHTQLRAEDRLCRLASKLVLGIVAGVLDKDWASGNTSASRKMDAKKPMQSRLLRNKGRLGPHYKELVAPLEAKAVKGRNRAATRPKVDGAAKSAELVLDEEDVEDIVEDEDGEAALRARGLVVDDDADEDERGHEQDDDVEQVESVLGD